ncbi:ribonuclease III [Candidatus Aerophobetes bacterium]|uniref:Ribonuclease 3 n=1 Tax=Aerophobetes bacterium TaxID=2030807 RepID=A0A523TCD5_UNCAE|nr:MAG: ribonuclease III [Candidatus Aerophobetes bacterium]
MQITSFRKRKLGELQTRLGTKFKNLNLLNQALTHSSYIRSKGKKSLFDYERLEFLGDAVLELLTAEYLFREYPQLSEGGLSKLRSRLVSKESLSNYAREIEVGKYLLIAKDQEGIQSQDTLLADAYEAIIGAVYLDDGLQVSRQLILSFLLSQKGKMQEINDFKSYLQEYVQSKHKSLPRYKMIQETGPDHQKKFKVEVQIKGKVMGKGWGFTKKKAEIMAARFAWKRIKTAEGRRQKKG